MTFALIYHYWNDGEGREVWRDIANPIVSSIATFRANNIRVPIYVLDVSRKRNDWGYFPFKLKFEVVRRPPHLGHDGRDGLSSSQIKLFSRSFDVPFLAGEIDADGYAFCDSDILWLRDMLPLPHSGFYCSRRNNGFYYWGRESGATEFFRAWQDACLLGIGDEAARQEIMSHYYADVFNDEAAYCYVRETRPELVKEAHLYDNWSGVRATQEVLENTKNVHLCQTNFGVRRGLMALIIGEFHEKLAVHLDEADLVRMFGERNMYLAGSLGLEQLHKAKTLLTDKRKIYT